MSIKGYLGFLLSLTSEFLDQQLQVELKTDERIKQLVQEFRDAKNLPRKLKKKIRKEIREQLRFLTLLRDYNPFKIKF